ncbi:hypothetical protein TNCV_1124911 [Trichonephila clavipes]|uniref:Uncharacterized protein n=1 Tax=Trichonephila clavipes TaxID=2585209 RepID=A0A8X6VLQ8_TRICX|nr:hypothetical protein TNCV_1124911 [Trichonephila clavipes]
MAATTLDAASQTEASSMVESTTNLGALIARRRFFRMNTDLSPTENVLSMVAKRLAHHHKPVTTVDELWHRVEAA